jgi:ABC-type glycerol-3-phosphate transport system substrate-binding protein
MAFTGSVLAACGDPAAIAPTMAPEAAAPAANATATSAPAVGAQTGQQFSGQIVVSISGEPLPAYQAVVDAYKKVQPNVEVVMEVPGLTPGDYPTWLGTQLAASNVRPDVVSGNYAGSYRGYVDLDAYRDHVSPYSNAAWDEDLDWDFFVVRGDNNKRILLPTRSVHILWFYNKDLFAQAQVEPPTNWQGLIAVCEKLQAAGITPISANFKWQVPQWIAEIYGDQYHINWVDTVRAQTGDWMFDPDLDGQFVFDPNDPNIHTKYTFNGQRRLKGLPDNSLGYDTPEMAELITNLSAVFPKYAVPDFFVIDNPYPPFLQQQAAILLDGTWTMPALAQDLQALSPERLAELNIEGGNVKAFEWGIFENPPMQSNLVQGPVRSVESASGEYLSIVDKNQQQTEMVVDFLHFWTSKVGYQPFVDAAIQSGNYTPGGPSKVRGVVDSPIVQELFSQVKELGNAEINYNNFLAWPDDLGTTARDLYKEALEGKMPAADFGKRLQTVLTDSYAEILEKSGVTQADIDNPAKQPGT